MSPFVVELIKDGRVTVDGEPTGTADEPRALADWGAPVGLAEWSGSALAARRESCSSARGATALTSVLLRSPLHLQPPRAGGARLRGQLRPACATTEVLTLPGWQASSGSVTVSTGAFLFNEPSGLAGPKFHAGLPRTKAPRLARAVYPEDAVARLYSQLVAADRRRMPEEDLQYDDLALHVLAPYVASAAHVVASGRGPRDRDRLALRVAATQLQAEQDALRGLRPPHVPPARAALVAPESPSIELASMALDATSRCWTDNDIPKDRVERLQRLIDLLYATDAGDSQAAAAMGDVFDDIVNELFFSVSSLSLADI